MRQSTLCQVFEKTESTKRQYGLRERAVALGWPLERVVVIDSDLGQPGAESDRVGFQKLVAAVGMGEVGLVLGLEVSRLARNSSDWHRLLEICALTGTLILDEDGLDDPSHRQFTIPASPPSRTSRWYHDHHVIAAAQSEHNGLGTSTSRPNFVYDTNFAYDSTLSPEGHTMINGTNTPTGPLGFCKGRPVTC